MTPSPLTAGFALARQAAAAAVGGQDFPTHTLYVLATPIGNLADIGLRALHVLGLADALACEDTRHTQQMLRAYGLERPGAELIALHQHNEAQASASIIARLASGQRVACVSDAGTPAISDPGARLVQAVRAAGWRVLPLPGPSSVTTALSAAGDTGDGFVFAGFLPSKNAERAQAVAQLAQEPRCVVLLEAPHRMAAMASSLAALGARQVTVGRELTKQFEQLHTLAAQELPGWLAERPEHSRGEFVLVVHAHTPVASHSEGERVLRRLLPELPLKSAVQVAADLSGEPRNALYALALTLKKTD